MHYSCLGGGVIRQIVNKQSPRLPNFFSNNLPRHPIQTSNGQAIAAISSIVHVLDPGHRIGPRSMVGGSQHHQLLRVREGHEPHLGVKIVCIGGNEHEPL